MAAWKQLLIVLVILVAATAAWVRFFPGAPEILAGWGLDWVTAPPSSEKTGATKAAGAGRDRGGAPQIPVVTAPVELATINDKLSAIGTGRANASVTVKPYASGRLTEVLVQSGATVEVGSVIAKLDSEAEQIALDRAKIALSDAEKRMERVQALRSSNTATAVQVTDAELALGNSRLEQREAELNYERRSILAPISGVVGILPVEPGNAVTTDTAIATIDDRSKIIIDFYVPERYAGAIVVGAPVSAVPIARPNQALDGTVSAVDSRLDEKSRTLLVQATIDNRDDTLRAGMSFQIAMTFPGDSYPSVNPLAIQWGTDGAFVWAIQDGKAKRTPVRIVQRNTESVLVEADIAVGDVVVIEGIHTVREGADLLIAGAEPTVAVEPAKVPPPSGGS